MTWKPPQAWLIFARQGEARKTETALTYDAAKKRRDELIRGGADFVWITQKDEL